VKAEIRQLSDASFDERALVALLTDAVDAGASVGFLAPLGEGEALAYWWSIRRELQNGLVLLGAYLEGRLVGSVQLAPAQKANARHRAEVQKLLVLREFRGRGIGRELMERAEDKARELGRTLLVLDTATDAAERLYQRMGYTKAGVIPDFAESSAGGLDPTVIYYKRLR
jgi:GNAT superfamily N-acetyltransferase